LRFDAETILGTIDWAHLTLRDYGVPSGYAMDAIMAKRVARFRGNPDRGRGHFARYLRGESSPSLQTVFDLDFEYSPTMGRIQLPMYEILRVGMQGYRGGGRDRCDEALLEVERRFQRRLTRYEDRGMVMTQPELNSRFGLDLCTYGSSHALTVLLVAAMQFQLWAERSDDSNDYERVAFARKGPTSRKCDPLLMGQRAFQCLILAIAAGEFPVTCALVVVRVRQRILDQLAFDGAVLDTAAIGIEDAVHVGRQALEQADAAGRTRSKQRAWLRAWLGDRANADCLRMTPPITTAAQAAESRARAPLELQLEAPALGRHSHRHQLGRKAKEILASALEDYIAKR
jgi:hypothetical protein